MGVKFKNQMNNKTLYNQFFISAAVELAKDQLTGLGPVISAAIELKELESLKPNHDPRTENKNKIFIFIDNVQATSDRVQAKRGTLINFFYN
tara:strand:- start:26 stop:301 length:276 start_codon:yes stop_codon:yes gene_type:complete